MEIVVRAQKCLKAQPPPLSWLSQALIMPEAEIATELSGLPLPELAAQLSSVCGQGQGHGGQHPSWLISNWEPCLGSILVYALR